MKRILQTLVIATLLSGCGKEQKASEETAATESEAQTPEQFGEELFNGKGNCFACHKPDQKIIAPSLVEIATIYKKENGDMVKFLREEAEPIVDPSQYETMKTNFSITKNMSDEELQGLQAYVLSFAK
ncbi:Cytochrome c [Flavobacterium longum]|uniref:c-type cytochrome n=1 Tax=Flavobacterium longum TaxID=1299340 RepID=UPI0039EB2F28